MVIDGNQVREPSSANAIGVVSTANTSTPATTVSMRGNKIFGYHNAVQLAATSASLSNDALVASTGTAVKLSAQSGRVDAQLTNVTFRDNGRDIQADAADLRLDSTLVQDPVLAAPTTQCVIVHSAGPTTGGTGCAGFQHNSLNAGFKDVPANDQPQVPNSVLDDHQLSSSSPLLDLGAETTPPGALDIEGRPRSVEMLCAGPRRDIGAHEVQGPDNCPPDTEIIGDPGPLSGRNVQFAYSSPDDDVDRFECTLKIGSGSAAPRDCAFDEDTRCAPSCTIQLIGLTSAPPAGTQHVFSILAVDSSGNKDSSPATHTWIVDRQLDPGVGPDAEFRSPPGPNAPAPTPPLESGTLDLQFFYRSVHRDAVRFTCQLDNAEPQACPHDPDPNGAADGLAGTTTLDVANGRHTFVVRAFDADGNSRLPATYEWEADSELNPGDAPETEITSAPANESGNAVTFTYRSPDVDVDGYVCQLGSAPEAPCPGDDNQGGEFGVEVPDGAGRMFRVRAVDADGNLDASPATHRWRVGDLRTVITDGPGEGATSPSDTAIQFDAGKSVDVTHFECSLDSGQFARCASPHVLTGLDDGPHRFRVRAVDSAGYADPEPASRAWTVRRVETAVKIATPPAAQVPGFTVAKKLKVAGRKLRIPFTARAGKSVAGKVVVTLTGTTVQANSAGRKVAKPVRLSRKVSVRGGAGSLVLLLKGPAAALKRAELDLQYLGSPSFNAKVLAGPSSAPERVVLRLRRKPTTNPKRGMFVQVGPARREAGQPRPQPNQLRLNAGQSTAITGVVLGADGKPLDVVNAGRLTVQVTHQPMTAGGIPVGSAEALPPAEVAADGTFRYVLPPRRNGEVRFAFTPGTRYGASSTVLGVKVIARPTVKAKGVRIKDGKLKQTARRFAIRGSVPAPVGGSGAVVAIQQRTGAAWRTLPRTTTRVSPTGTYRVTVTLKRKVTARMAELRAVVRPSPAYLYESGMSSAVLLKIPARSTSR